MASLPTDEQTRDTLLSLLATRKLMTITGISSERTAEREGMKEYDTAIAVMCEYLVTPDTAKRAILHDALSTMMKKIERELKGRR